MTNASPARAPAAAPHTPATAPRRRDPRLDFFRGLGMFIIFVAHLPWNSWTLWIPARFGFSDATEIFVFCSGMASAIAFGRVFETQSWSMGVARVAHRIWQVYWAHVALFLVIAGLVWTATQTGWFARDYVGELNLYPFFDRVGQQLTGLLTLTYVPNYFDILPMYIAILAMMPLVMALKKVGTWAALLAVAATWLAANFRLLELPAEPWSQRSWFFNPFAWQLVFFTGFAFMRGWIKPPPVTRAAIVLAAVVVLATVPFAYFRILNAVPELREMANALRPLTDKTHFGILRYVHFLSLAYLAWIAAGAGGARLTAGGLWGGVVRVVQQFGQQSLAVFLMSLVAAQSIGIARDYVGATALTHALANLAGFAVLIATAYTVAWFKSQPWSRRPAKPAPPAEATEARGDTPVRAAAE